MLLSSGRWFGAIVAAGLVGLCSCAVAAEEAAHLDDATVLELAHHEFVRGRLLKLDDNSVVWQANGFHQPLEFLRTSVRGLSRQHNPLPSASKFQLELAGGDIVHADRFSIDQDAWHLSTGDKSVLRVQAEAVQAVIRADDGEKRDFQVPRQLSDWTAKPAASWEESGAATETTTLFARLWADGCLPEKCIIDVAFTWADKSPNFSLYLGTDENGGEFEQAFSLEVSKQYQLIQRRTSVGADLAELPQSAEALRLTIYLDLQSGWLQVHDQQGQRLGAIEVPTEEQQPNTGLMLLNRGKHLRLEDLQVRRWSGRLPTSGNREAIQIQTASATLDAATIYTDADGKLFAVEHASLGQDAANGDNQTADDDEINGSAEPNAEGASEEDSDSATDSESDSTALADSADGPARSGDDGAVDAAAGTRIRWADLQSIAMPKRAEWPSGTDGVEYTLLLQDGQRWTGRLLSGADDTVQFRPWWGDATIAVPIGDIWQCIVRKDTAAEPPEQLDPPEGARFGRLHMMDTRLSGWVTNGNDDGPTGDEQAAGPARGTASPVWWRCSQAVAAVPLATDAMGRVFFREIRPDAATTPTELPEAQERPRAAVQNQPFLFQVFGFGKGNAKRPKKEPDVQQPKADDGEAPAAPHRLHLLSGDRVDCEVVGINEAGVLIRSPSAGDQRVPHRLIQAVQIQSTRRPPLANPQRGRLLTVPRMQRSHPPQHLLFSSKGDALRGDVVGLTRGQLEVELRLRPRSIPLQRVHSIVWLHPETADKKAADKEAAPDLPQDESAAPATTQPNGEQLFVQAVTGHSRVSFQIDAITGQQLTGRSEVLGEVKADLWEIDQLLLGEFVHLAAAHLPHGKYQLVAAQDPKFVSADEDGGDATPAANGTQSVLVGKPAPKLNLKTLDLKSTVQLESLRDRVVVLDFWATWCGPCLQAMPIVDRVAEEFGEDVQLYAVNLEETPEQIKRVLERRKLDVDVLLDRDGVAAGRYQATAIPQTVVIDRQGTITRVFVGSSRGLEDDLRTALREALDDKS